jgi:hypothetical protein
LRRSLAEKAIVLLEKLNWYFKNIVAQFIAQCIVALVTVK